MYDSILYPTDGSRGAEAALETVRELAETTRATVHVLHSIDTRHAALGLAGDPKSEDSPGMVGNPQGESAGMVGDRSELEDIRDTVRDEAQTIVEETADALGALPTETVVANGNPHKVILSYADKEGIDVIVMGTHGRSGLDRYLLGSVTEKVVRLSDIPVLTVRGGN